MPSHSGTPRSSCGDLRAPSPRATSAPRPSPDAFSSKPPRRRPPAYLRGWQLLREAADSGLGTAWDALGRVCLDWLLIQGFPEGLDRQDPAHAVIPARDAFPALAQECFRRAIECGCTTGYNGLSWVARDGMGTKDNRQDYALGEEWDREAAERRETLDMVAGALFNENA